MHNTSLASPAACIRCTNPYLYLARPDLTLPYLPHLVYILTFPRVVTPTPEESQLGE